MSENIPALIAEARERHRRTARHLPDPTSPTLVSRLADALESLSAPPATDDALPERLEARDSFVPETRMADVMLEAAEVIRAACRPSPVTREALEEVVGFLASYGEYVEVEVAIEHVRSLSRFSLPEPAEVEWEYGIRSEGDDAPWSDISDDPDWLADSAGSLREDGDHFVRRVKAGPWVPVPVKGAEQ